MPALLAVAVLAAAGLVAWLRGPAARRREPAAQAALERAVAAVDRELAADLELAAMFDQTKQAFVMELGEFEAAREVIEREAPGAYAVVSDVYARIPATESAMERRGPAGSIADADRAAIEAWEGDAREAQRALRAAVAPAPVPRWRALAERLGARLPAS